MNCVTWQWLVLCVCGSWCVVANAVVCVQSVICTQALAVKATREKVTPGIPFLEALP